MLVVEVLSQEQKEACQRHLLNLNEQRRSD